MERLYGVGPSRGVDGSIPGLGEVECAVLLPGPGGGMEGGGSQMWPHGVFSGSIKLPPRGGRSLDHVYKILKI